MINVINTVRLYRETAVVDFLKNCENLIDFNQFIVILKSDWISLRHICKYLKHILIKPVILKLKSKFLFRMSCFTLLVGRIVEIS